MAVNMRQGKLPSNVLNALIEQLDQSNMSIVIPPKRGIDAAGLKLGNGLFAISTDPVVRVQQHIGATNISVNMNDVACLGAKPTWFTATLLLPEGFSEAELRYLWDEFVTALNRYDVKAIGGHIEVTSAVTRPVMVGQMMGECIGDTLLDPRDCEPGDHVLLWQAIGLEGTAILATDYHNKLTQHFSTQAITKMQQLVCEPGLCVWPLVEKLLPHSGVVALHDPTVGGVANALHELANNSQCGVHIQENALNILPETKTLCTLFGLDPLGLLATGSLLIVCCAHAKDDILAKLADEPVRHLGQFVANPTERLLYAGHKVHALPQFDGDELTKLTVGVAI